MLQQIKISVYIDNVLSPLELDGTENITIVKGVANVGEPAIILSTILYTIELPKTPLNSRSLQFAGFRGNDNGLVFNRIKCQVSLNGFVLFPTAVMIIGEIADKYKVNIMGDGSLFLDQIKPRSIKDLDLSDLQFNWTITDVVGYNSGDFILGYLDTGAFKDYTFKQAEIAHLIPFVKHNVIFERLFIASSNPALDRDFSHNNLAANNVNDLQYISLVTTNLSATQISNIKAAQMVFDDQLLVTGDGSQFLFKTSDVSNIYSIINGQKYTALVEGNYTFNLPIEYDIFDNATGVIPTACDVTLKANVYFADGTLYTTVVIDANNVSSLDTTYNFTTFLRQNQYIKLEAEFVGVPYDLDFIYYATLNCSQTPTANTPKPTSTFSGFYLDLASNLPDINQLEYFRYYLQLNQAFVTFNLPNEIVITKYSEFFDKYRQGQVNDLSQYFVQVESVEFRTELAKENWYKYPIDSGDGEQTWANYSFDNNTGEGEKTLYTTPFAPSLQSQMQCTDITNATTGTFTTTLTQAWTRNTFKTISSGTLVRNNYYIVTSLGSSFDAANCGSTNVVGNVFLAKATTPTSWGGGSVELYDFQRQGYEPRNVLLNSTNAQSGEYAIYTDYYNGGVVSNVTTDIPLLTFSELQWSNLVNTDWLSGLQNVQRFTILCRLPEDVFFNLDLSKPTYFKQLQHGLFVEKIEGYTGGWSNCRVVGVKIQP